MSGEEPTVVPFTKEPEMRWFTPQELAAPPILFVPVPPDAEDASLMTKAQRLRRELATWAKAGAPMAVRGIRLSRLRVCSACEYYDPKGNWGLGQCRAPGCGCTKVKAYLATSKCPKGKWPA